MIQSENIVVRPAQERGHVTFDWLNTYHTFSFGEYRDDNYMGFRSVRVLNDDTVLPGKGFGMHPHKDMEILTYVIEGELQHKDSLGNGSVISRGLIQRMTAGSGIVHSEMNPSEVNHVRLLQIWIIPETKGLAPSYEELSLDDCPEHDGLTLIASNRPRQGVLIHQDVQVYRGLIKEDMEVDYDLRPGRGAWVQMIDGKMMLNDSYQLKSGDGASIENENIIKVRAGKNCEFLLFDLK